MITLDQAIQDIIELNRQDNIAFSKRQDKLRLMWSEANDNLSPNIDCNGRFPNHSHNETSSKYTCRWRPIVDFDGHTEYSHVAIKNKSTGAITYGKIYYHDYHDEYFFVLYKDYQKYTYKKVSEMITDSDISWYYLDYDVPPLEV